MSVVNSASKYNLLKIMRYMWSAKLFIAFVLISGIVKTYTLVYLIIEEF